MHRKARTQGAGSHTFILLLLVLCAFPAAAAKYKPIHLHPEYRHDRWLTLPTDIVQTFRAYTTSFDSADDDNGDGIPDYWRVPHFVAYEIRRYEGDLGKGPKRPSPWLTDKALKRQNIAPNDASYKYSRAFRATHSDWYDRGHLCAKYHAWRLGASADWNTHTVLNAVPQRHKFNDGIWGDLEDLTAKWANKYGAVWVIAGPIFNNRTPSNWIGEANKHEKLVAVPDFVFKILVRESGDPDRPEVLAFRYPQQGAGFGRSPYDHEKYLVSIDRIEEETGLDFLTSLPDEAETAIESEPATHLWE